MQISWSTGMMRNRFEFPLLAAAALLCACGPARPTNTGQPDSVSAAAAAFSQRQGGDAMAFTVQSTAFTAGGTIPARYTCDGANLSPALSWKDAPAGTQSLALIADDPDAPAGTWTHWILWNLPPQATLLPEGVPPSETLANGARQGRNNFQRLGYGGPCPPPGKAHRYFFRLYALDARLDQKPGAVRSELEAAMQGHVLAQSEWMGRYAR
jgi:Raf kinase inhibitor-like YbhB/YbcL family protein